MTLYFVHSIVRGKNEVCLKWKVTISLLEFRFSQRCLWTNYLPTEVLKREIWLYLSLLQLWVCSRCFCLNSLPANISSWSSTRGSPYLPPPSCCFLVYLTVRPWRWREYTGRNLQTFGDRTLRVFPRKLRWISAGLYGVSSPKIVLCLSASLSLYTYIYLWL
jgi:hypothetical protein